MSELLTIAAQEYRQQVWRKGFLLATFGIPLGIALLIALVVMIVLRAERAEVIGYVDQAGLLAGLDEHTAILPPPSYVGAFSDMAVTAIRYPSEEAGRAALEAETIEALFVVPADYQTTGAVTGYAPQGMPQLAQERFELLLRRAQIAQLGGLAERLEAPISEVTTLTADGRPLNHLTNFLLPLIFTFLMAGASFSSSSYLMQGLVEEKQNRLLEILATTITPGRLMGGKIIGLGLLGLTQLAAWVATGVAGLQLARGYLPDLAEVAIPWPSLLLLLGLFVPTYLLMAATLSALGATVTATQEGQQMASHASLLIFSPFWFMGLLQQAPDSALAVGMSLFPYSAPVTLLIRSGMTEVPAWQYIAAALLLMISALGMTWLAGRLLRYGMLHAGKRLGLRDLRTALLEV